ncbi:MAG: Helicase associated domain protein [Magnetococcales bacterium]|nr:Helicase associated domain protein [Magnetococcales bacterium]
MLPKHPDARRFGDAKLFYNLSSFKELEERLSDLTVETKTVDKPLSQTTIPTEGSWEGLAANSELEEKQPATSQELIDDQTKEPLDGETSHYVTKEVKLAFALFVEGLLASRSFYQATEVLPASAITAETRKRFCLPEKLTCAHGYFKTSSGETHPYALYYCHNREELTDEQVAEFQNLIKHSLQPLLISNTKTLPKVLQKQDGFHRILAPDLDLLSPLDFTSFNRWLKGGGILPTRNAPSPVQAEALNIIRGLSDNRALLVSSMGNDILQTARHLLENLGNQRCGLVILPSQNHIRDFINNWQKQTSWATIAPLVFVKQPAKLKQSDFNHPLTSTTGELRQFLGLRLQSGIKIILATADILPTLQQAILGYSPIDLALIIEAHHLVSPWGEKINPALQDSDLPIKKLYLLTSTPYRLDALKPNKEGELKALFRLDDKELYGPVVHLATMADGIQKKSIRNWKFLLPIIDDKESQLDAIALCHSEKPEICHIHTRHEKPALAREFADNFLADAPATINHFIPFCVEGLKTATQIDEQYLLYAKSNHAILSLTSTIESGFNLNPADMVFFINGSKKENPSTYEPVLRKIAEQKSGYIAVAIRKNANGDCTEGLNNSDDLWASLQLFKEQDSSFAQELRDIRINFGRTGKWNIEHLNKWLEIVQNGEEQNRVNSEAILINCVKRLSNLWDENFGQLLAFRDKNNHCEIPQRLADNPQLSQWVEQQRKNHVKNSLLKSRYQELTDIGFIWDPKKTAWERMYKELVIYKSQHNHCKVPKGWSDNPELADWVSRQRREKQSARLDKEWEEKLTMLGFVWDLEVDAWEAGFKALEKFYKIHGHGAVPQNYPHNPKLADWAELQRRNDKKGSLTAEREDRLNSLGFVWNLEVAAWEELFALFERYKLINGHGKIPDKDPHMPKLAEWAKTQRRDKTTGKLPPIRQERLEMAGFVWDLEQTYWDEMFALLKGYKFKYGHCTLPDRGLEKGSADQTLSLWCQEQRSSRKRGRLHPSKIHRLTALGFTWDLKIAAWEQMFADFKFFKLCHGHGKLSDLYPAKPSLGQWAKTLRRELKIGTIDKDRKARVDEAGFVWDLEQAAWDEQFASLITYYKSQGHFNLPPNLKTAPDLPSWVKKQRLLKSKNILKKDRQAKLDEIGFIWDVKEAAWEEMFTALTDFTNSRNHCIVPPKWPQNPRLAQWVNNLRRDYKKGTLNQEHQDRLSQLGFLWDAKAIFWEEMFVALTEYRDHHGDCLVPESYAQNSELGWWVATQRKAKLSGQLDQPRIQRLDALGFIWDIAEANWLDMYRQLFIFAHEKGHCLVSKSHPATMLLSKWCDNQRKAKANNTLSQDQINRLSELNFVWEQKQVIVEEMMIVLKAFKEEQGHCNVPTQGSKYSQLGLWLQFQRQSYKKGELDPLRQQKLEEMGFEL